ncbi:MAG TPA: methyltransferase domain-containing protein [Candidatus Andersenbacteria bacterium]|nr:MAG: hypothetical protein A2854_04600 [Parcubacteria group bacterium RIFCSPHIGHO2_01_FULL_56_18]HLD25605.1 methyltransferase domain-containing protein [Candidatus Andersenbacteria bacterium]
MYRSILDTIVRRLLASSWRVPILKELLRVQSFFERWISTFAVENGMHPKHRLTKYHEFFINNLNSADHVLDIGCGYGDVAFDAAQVAASVTGIDFDEASIAEARRRYQAANLTFLVGDAVTHQFNQSFSVIIMSNVLEHIDNRVGLLQKIKALAPKLLLRVPMLDRDWLPLLKQELGLDYRLDPTHRIEYTEAIFRQELANAGYTIKHLHVRFGEMYCVATAA